MSDPNEKKDLSQFSVDDLVMELARRRGTGNMLPSLATTSNLGAWATTGCNASWSVVVAHPSFARATLSTTRRN
jgi:hypothetical protein